MHSITRQGGKLVALVRGRLNREEAETLALDMERALKEPGAPGMRLLVDISHVEYLSSSGITALVRIFKAASDAKMTMAVYCGKPEVRSLMEIAGVDRLIKILDRPEQG